MSSLLSQANMGREAGHSFTCHRWDERWQARADKACMFEEGGLAVLFQRLSPAGSFLVCARLERSSGWERGVGADAPRETESNGTR